MKITYLALTPYVSFSHNQRQRITRDTEKKTLEGLDLCSQSTWVESLKLLSLHIDKA